MSYQCGLNVRKGRSFICVQTTLSFFNNNNNNIIIMLYLKKVTQLAQGYSSLRPSLKDIYKNGNNMRNACQKQYI